MPRVGPLQIRARLMCGDEFALGPGKASLLEAIAREGSISAAGRALGMSYRRTWLLVDEMNRCWEQRLVETTPGGGQSRGARLSAMGHRVLSDYRALEARLAETAEAALASLRQGLRETPLPPAKPPRAG
jgi:molybdate transport system regulatory protein